MLQVLHHTATALAVACATSNLNGAVQSTMTDTAGAENTSHQHFLGPDIR